MKHASGFNEQTNDQQQVYGQMRSDLNLNQFPQPFLSHDFSSQKIEEVEMDDKPLNNYSSEVLFLDEVGQDDVGNGIQNLAQQRLQSDMTGL